MAASIADRGCCVALHSRSRKHIMQGKVTLKSISPTGYIMYYYMALHLYHYLIYYSWFEMLKSILCMTCGAANFDIEYGYFANM